MYTLSFFYTLSIPLSRIGVDYIREEDILDRFKYNYIT